MLSMRTWLVWWVHGRTYTDVNIASAQSFMAFRPDPLGCMYILFHVCTFSWSQQWSRCADGAREELSKDNKASSCGFVKRRTKIMAIQLATLR
jgi:hypothetical protein